MKLPIALLLLFGMTIAPAVSEDYHFIAGTKWGNEHGDILEVSSYDPTTGQFLAYYITSDGFQYYPVVGRKDPDGSTIGWTLVWINRSHMSTAWLGELHYDYGNKPVILTTRLETEMSILYVPPNFTQHTTVSVETFQLTGSKIA